MNICVTDKRNVGKEESKKWQNMILQDLRI